MERLTKKFLIIAASVLVLCLVGGFFAAKFIENHSNKVATGTTQPSTSSTETVLTEPSETPSPTPSPSSTLAKNTQTPTPTQTSAPSPTPVAPVKSAPSYSAAFQWGVTMRPNVLGKYSSSNWADQISMAKKLGVGWARINWDYDNSDPAGRNTQIISALKSSGIKTVLVIEHNPAHGTANMYQQGLDDAKTITAAVRGDVDFYQLANEGGAESLISGKSGTSASDFDTTRYNNVKDYIKGLGDGIASGDPAAKKIVTISWVHTGFIERLINDNVNFDMVGIDWYSWMGSFSAKKINSSETVYHKLQTFGKPLTFMEVSTMPTAGPDGDKYKTIVDETAQANFLTNTANWAWANRDWVKGFYHFELVDNTFSAGYIDYYGLIKVTTTNGQTALGAVRQAFNAYHDLIAGK